MALLEFGDVWQNFLKLAVVFIVFYLLYSSLKEGKMKEGIKKIFEKMKPKEKND